MTGLYGLYFCFDRNDRDEYCFQPDWEAVKERTQHLILEMIKAKVAAINTTVRMVVHAAGVPVAGGVLEANPVALSQAVNIKAGGMLRLHRATDAHLVRGSRLVAVGGHYGFEPTAYAATAGVANAGLTNLMRQFSWALGERGITAHLVAPGPADTER